MLFVSHIKFPNTCTQEDNALEIVSDKNEKKHKQWMIMWKLNNNYCIKSGASSRQYSINWIKIREHRSKKQDDSQQRQ